jgi:hypothetical protein
MALKQLIEDTRRFVLEARIEEAQKDYLGTLLDAAEHVANGTQDKLEAIAASQGTLLVAFVKHCVRDSGGGVRDESRVGRVLRVLFPWRWCLTVLGCVGMLVLGSDGVLAVVRELR